jgi:hypothetical protein
MKKLLSYIFIYAFSLASASCKENKKDQNLTDSLPTIKKLSLHDRLFLFTNTLNHSTEFDLQQNSLTGLYVLALRYPYPDYIINYKRDSLIRTVGNDLPLLTNFVLADSTNLYESIDFCLGLEGDLTDTCYEGFKLKVQIEYPGELSEEGKAELFSKSLNRPVEIDSTSSDEMKFTIHTNYPTDFEVREYHAFLTKRYARLLYVYFLEQSKRYNGCAFTIINTNEKKQTEHFDYRYRKGDDLFKSIMEYVRTRPVE